MRQSGRTTEGLIVALREIAAGRDVAFIVPTVPEVSYTKCLLAHLRKPDKVSGNRFLYGISEFRVMHIGQSPDALVGFRGVVRFDHAAFESASRRQVFGWHDIAHCCEIQHEPIQ